jgi:hypothetical protein
MLPNINFPGRDNYESTVQKKSIGRQFIYGIKMALVIKKPPSWRNSAVNILKGATLMKIKA